MARRRIDRTGQKIHMLTFIQFMEVRNRQQLWLCKCDCGVEKIINSFDIIKLGGTKSCGCIKAASRCSDDSLSFNQLYKNYSWGAKQRGYEWSISKELFRQLTSNVCIYCGEIPSTIKIHKRSDGSFSIPYMYNGLDRVNNAEGYTINNVVPCCSMCNYMKGEYSRNEFLEHICKINNYQIKEY